MSNISEWQGSLFVVGSFVKIWEFYLWRENEAGFIFSPQAVLAGIILSNVIPYLETISHLPNLWRQSQYDWVSVDAMAEVGRGRGEGWRAGKGTNKRST